MPRVIEKTVYKFDELWPAAQEKAIESYRNEEGYLHDEWWDAVYECVETAAGLLGIEIDRKPVTLYGGGQSTRPAIYFSGFCHQGSGSSFDGDYSYEKGCVKAVKKEFPSDEDLHKIAADLVAIQKSEAYKLTAAIKSHRDTSISVEVGHADYAYPDLKDGSENGIEQTMRDFNSWIFKSLEEEYEYQMSDESVKESIEANEAEFTEEGESI